MGWKRYFYLGQSEFKTMYDNLKSWGELAPAKVTHGGVDYYGVGTIHVNTTPWMQSGKVSHYQGYRTRITVKYIVYIASGAYGKVDIGIVFYTNDKTATDQSGNDVHGAGHTITQPPASNTAEFHEMVVEQQNNTITITVDGTNLGSWSLSGTLNSFTVACMIEDVHGAELGIVVYEVSAEYYDVMEDIINQITQMFNLMIWIMIPLVIIMLIISLFRRKPEETR